LQPSRPEFGDNKNWVPCNKCNTFQNADLNLSGHECSAIGGKICAGLSRETQ